MQQSISVQDHDPLTTARSFLNSVWEAADLHAMFLPIWGDAFDYPESRLIDSPEQIQDADPFAPVMPANRAPHALQVLEEHRDRRIGVFLRPCEWRTVRVMVSETSAKTDNLFSMSADCTGAMTVNNYLQLGGDEPIKLSYEVLQFASQGGILPSRRQSSCQLCEDPFPTQVDLHLQLFGVPTNEFLGLTLADDALAHKLSQGIPLSAPPADAAIRREQVLTDLSRWRVNSFEKRKQALGADQISIDRLVAHLRSCPSCQASLNAHCPTLELESLLDSQTSSSARIKQWLGSCSGCGVCDRECPDDYPLFSVIFALRDQLS
jgi:Pyruvate/2-oxoacid:ferredoxin oxidoreductase delta subunit